MLAPAVARRGLVALMNVVPASAAARFDTSARSARVLRPLDAEGREAEHRGLNRWGILAEDRLVEDWARRRLDLKPGTTGLWQVMGRDDIPFDEMTRLDHLDVTSWSLWQDLNLILRTFPVIAHWQRSH